MPNLTYPGVYIDEVSSGARPLEIAGTSTAAFVGLAEKGSAEATRVTSWPAFQRLYGGFVPDSYLAQSVFAYFNNGGRQCYIVRVVLSDAVVADVTVANRAAQPAPGITFSAKDAGAWGNHLVLQIEDASTDPGNRFRISVRRQPDAEVIAPDFAGSPTLEDFDDLSCDESSDRFVEAVLEHESSLITARMLATNKVQKVCTAVEPAPRYRSVISGVFGSISTAMASTTWYCPPRPGRRILRGSQARSRTRCGH